MSVKSACYLAKGHDEHLGVSGGIFAGGGCCPPSVPMGVLQEVQGTEGPTRLANALAVGEPASVEDGPGYSHEDPDIHPGDQAQALSAVAWPHPPSCAGHPLQLGTGGSETTEREDIV